MKYLKLPKYGLKHFTYTNGSYIKFTKGILNKVFTSQSFYKFL